MSHATYGALVLKLVTGHFLFRDNLFLCTKNHISFSPETIIFKCVVTTAPLVLSSESLFLSSRWSRVHPTSSRLQMTSPSKSRVNSPSQVTANWATALEEKRLRLFQVSYLLQHMLPVDSIWVLPTNQRKQHVCRIMIVEATKTFWLWLR